MKEEKVAEEAREPLRFDRFARQMFPFLTVGRFHAAYYRVLEAFARGKIRRLIVTIPPQHGKSLGATTLLPAYMLGLDPELKIAIASYSASLANRFNRRVQRLIDSQAYAALFPETTVKRAGARSEYVRTADCAEIVGHQGEVMSVGREGSLTGNRVDVLILDDLYKDAMEANSPLVRENCWEWYTSVVRTRMHNASSELIVFTRWHDEDLIGELRRRERCVELREWADIDRVGEGEWLSLNFEALKSSPACGIDPRGAGEALWPERQSAALLESKRRLDPLRFECMYQGHPSPRGGLLYGDGFVEYDTLPAEIVRYAGYTDTADTGDDYLCSVAYAVDADGMIYLLDAVYSREPMEVTEGLVAEMVGRTPIGSMLVESNNGGRGFARALQRLLPRVRIEWFHQSGNKEARILSYSATVIHTMRFPRGWAQLWPEMYAHLTSYSRIFRSNRWHDAPDVLTGIIEREASGGRQTKIRSVGFF